MKEAAKVREETFPLMLLANLKGYPDSSTFRLMSYGFPKIDATVATEAGRFNLQITTADPIRLRPNGSPSNGGYDERLVREALNRAGIVHGLAAMRRDDGIIVSGKPGDRSMKNLKPVFACVVEKGFDLIGRTKLEAAFGAYYFVDEGSRIFFEHSC